MSLTENAQIAQPRSQPFFSKAATAQFALGAIRLAAGLTLLWSGLLKVFHPFEFLGNVYHFQIVNAKMSLLVAVCIPWLEIAAAFSLLAGVFLESGFVITGILGLIFTGAIASAMWRGLQISCGCFSALDDSLIGYGTLLRAAAIFAAGVIGLWLLAGSQRNSTEPD